MRIYLDMCCFNRPYDDQTQARIHLETQGKLLLQQRVRDGFCDLVWSSILDLECANNPFVDRQLAISQWRYLACERVLIDDRVLKKLHKLGTLVALLPGEAIAKLENWYEN